MLRAFVRSGARAATHESADLIGSAVRGAEHAAGDAPRVVERAENTALHNTVREVEQPVINTVNQNTAGWKGAAATAAGGVGVAAIGVGGAYLAHQTIKNDVNEVANGASNAMSHLGHELSNGYDNTKGNMSSLLESAEGALAALPGQLEGARSVVSGGVTGSVTMLLVLGVGVFAAFELYRFSR